MADSRAGLRSSAGGGIRMALSIVLPAFFLLSLYESNSLFFLRAVPPLWLGFGVNYFLAQVALWVLGVGYLGWSNCFSAQFPFPACGVASNLYLDFLTAAMLLWLFASVRRYYSTIRALEVTTFFVMLLPFEIALGDFSEFGLHVTDFQVYFGVVPWFTNADLLWVSSLVLVALLVMDFVHLWKPGVFHHVLPSWNTSQKRA